MVYIISRKRGNFNPKNEKSFKDRLRNYEIAREIWIDDALGRSYCSRKQFRNERGGGCFKFQGDDWKKIPQRLLNPTLSFLGLVTGPSFPFQSWE